MDEPNNLSYDEESDQEIIELLTSSHKATYTRTKISYQSRTSYELLELTIQGKPGNQITP